MHAVVAIFAMDEARFGDQRKSLQEVIIPRAKGDAGFRAGYWTRDHASGRSCSLLVLDTKEQARHLCETVERNAEQQREIGIELEFVAVTEVVGEAHRYSST